MPDHNCGVCSVSKPQLTAPKGAFMLSRVPEPLFIHNTQFKPQLPIITLFRLWSDLAETLRAPRNLRARSHLKSAPLGVNFSVQI